MFYDTDHPNVSLSDWERFLKELPTHLIAEVMDRSEAKLPNCFVPLARGVAIASDALLRKAGHHHRMNRPCGWRKSVRGCDVFVRDIGPEGREHTKCLNVRQCCNQGLWTSERWREMRRWDNSDEMLVHEFGSTPIFTRSRQAAMRLATYCHENGPPDGLRWISACPKDGKDAVEFARERNIIEALVGRNAHQEDHLRGAA
jgi:hypothetical protein